MNEAVAFPTLALRATTRERTETVSTLNLKNNVLVEKYTTRTAVNNVTHVCLLKRRSR